MVNSVGISEQDMSIFQEDTERFFQDNALCLHIGWSLTAAEVVEAQRRGEEIQIVLEWRQVDNWAESYLRVVDSSATHLAELIAHPIANRQRWGPDARRLVDGKADTFIEDHLSRDVVRYWLAGALDCTIDPRRFQGFDAVLEQALTCLDQIRNSKIRGLSELSERDARVSLVVASLGKNHPAHRKGGRSKDKAIEKRNQTIAALANSYSHLAGISRNRKIAASLDEQNFSTPSTWESSCYADAMRHRKDRPKFNQMVSKALKHTLRLTM